MPPSLEYLQAKNLFDLRGSVIIVTGGGTVRLNLSHLQFTGPHPPQGIGLMIASTLISNGATVYIVGPPGTQADMEELVTCLILSQPN